MTRLVVRQYGTEWLEWYVSDRRRRITQRDVERIGKVVDNEAGIEQGYYDIALSPGQTDDSRHDLDAVIAIK